MDFIIKVIVDPSQATTGAKSVRKELELVERSAATAGKETGRATKETEGMGAAAREVRKQLELVEGEVKGIGFGAKVAAGNTRAIGKEARDLERASRGAGAATKEIEKNTRAANKEAEKLSGAAAEIQRQFRRAFSVAALALAVRGTARLADEYTNIQNRLRLVTDGTEGLAAATSELFEISNDTRISFASTAEVYARTALAARELGRDQEELLAFTKSLNQAVILSGASAQEANAGLIQLSQGIGSGALRGEELRSVLEQIPVVADVIAKSLGVTRGELRDLGAEGKISAEVVLDAFKEQRAELERQFQTTVPTLGQAFTVLRNGLTDLVGTVDESTGASAAAATGLIFFAENLDVAAAGALVLAVSVGGALVPSLIAGIAASAGMIASVKGLTLAVLSSPILPAAAAFAALGFAVSAAADKFIELKEAQDAANASGSGNGLTPFGEIGDDILRTRARIENIERSGATSDFLTNKILPRLRDELAALQTAQGLLADGSAKTTVQALQQVAALQALADAVDNSLSGIAEQNGLLALNSREREVQARLLREIAALEKGDGPAVSPEQKAELEAAIRRNQALEDQASALERIRGPQQNFEADLSAIQVLLADGTINQEEFNAELERLVALLEGVDRASLDFSGSFDPEEIRKQIAAARAGLTEDPGGGSGAPLPETGLSAELQLQQDLYDGIRGPQQAFQETQAALNALLADGAISAEEYAFALNNARIASNTLSSDAAQGAAAGLAQVQNRLNDISGATAQQVVSGFGAAEDALTGFILTGEAGFGAFVDQIQADAARLLAQQALSGLIGAFGGGGGTGAGGGFLAGLFGGARADGGDVNPNQAFLVGEDGPELFSPPNAGTITGAEQTAAMIAGSGAPVINVPPSAPPTVIFVDDPDAVPSALETPNGEDAVARIVNRQSRRGSGRR